MSNLYKAVLWLILAAALLAAYPAFSIRTANDARNRTVVAAADYTAFVKQAAGGGKSGGGLLEVFRKYGINTVAIDYKDTEALKMAKNESFDVMLSVNDGIKLQGNGQGSVGNQSKADNLEDLIRNYNVRYITFKGAAIPGYPSQLPELSALIEKYSLIIALTETGDQTGIVECKGLDELLEMTGYPATRMYVTPESDLKKLSSDELYYRWRRGLIDRSIRFIYVSPLGNSMGSSADNGGTGPNGALSAAERFLDYTSANGYITGDFASGKTFRRLSDEKPPRYTGFCLLLSSFVALLLLMEYTLKPRGKRLAVTVAVTQVIFVCLSLLMPGKAIDEGILLPLLPAVLYPALSITVMMSYIETQKSRPLAYTLTGSVLCVLVINIAGCYAVSAAMPDLKYTLGFYTFKGVAFAYLLPVVLFISGFLVFMKDKGVFEKGNMPVFFKLRQSLVKLRRHGTKPEGYSNTGKRFPLKLLIAATLFIIFLAIYLLRSTTEGILKPSAFELQLREVLENVMTVRPRFKEFIVGYPSLFIFIYLMREYLADHKSSFARSILPVLPMLGTGAVIGSISMVNSFCHVFTPIMVSIHRTINGFLLGLPLGLIALAAVSFAVTAGNSRRV